MEKPTKLKELLFEDRSPNDSHLSCGCRWSVRVRKQNTAAPFPETQMVCSGSMLSVKAPGQVRESWSTNGADTSGCLPNMDLLPSALLI